LTGDDALGTFQGTLVSANVEEEAADSPLVKLLPAQLPDPKRLPGGFVMIHAAWRTEKEAM